MSEISSSVGTGAYNKQNHEELFGEDGESVGQGRGNTKKALSDSTSLQSRGLKNSDLDKSVHDPAMRAILLDMIMDASRKDEDTKDLDYEQASMLLDWAIQYGDVDDKGKEKEGHDDRRTVGGIIKRLTDDSNADRSTKLTADHIDALWENFNNDEDGRGGTYARVDTDRWAPDQDDIEDLANAAEGTTDNRGNSTLSKDSLFNIIQPQFAETKELSEEEPNDIVEMLLNLVEDLELDAFQDAMGAENMDDPIEAYYNERLGWVLSAILGIDLGQAQGIAHEMLSRNMTVEEIFSHITEAQDNGGGNKADYLWARLGGSSANNTKLDKEGTSALLELGYERGQIHNLFSGKDDKAIENIQKVLTSSKEEGEDPKDHIGMDFNTLFEKDEDLTSDNRQELALLLLKHKDDLGLGFEDGSTGVEQALRLADAMISRKEDNHQYIEELLTKPQKQDALEDLFDATKGDVFGDFSGLGMKELKDIGDGTLSTKDNDNLERLGLDGITSDQLAALGITDTGYIENAAILALLSKMKGSVADADNPQDAFKEVAKNLSSNERHMLYNMFVTEDFELGKDKNVGFDNQSGTFSFGFGQQPDDIPTEDNKADSLNMEAIEALVAVLNKNNKGEGENKIDAGFFKSLFGIGKE